MGATAGFTELGGPAGTSFPHLGALEHELPSLGGKLLTDYCFEGIIGNRISGSPRCVEDSEWPFHNIADRH